MTPHEVDVSWEVLRKIAVVWAGDGAQLDSATPLCGGSINTTLILVLRDGRKAVLKITPHRVNRAYADEAWQLALLSQAGLPVPEVYKYKLGSLDDPFSYILMEFVEGVDLAQARSACPAEQFDALQAELAEYVFKLHERTHSHFQRAVGGEARRFEKWHDCYHELCDPLWKEVEKSAVLPIRMRKVVSKIHERLDRFLCHDDCPRLVHGDLWSTNLMCRADEQMRWHIAAFLDPNCKYGHAEAELAYLELFHTVTPTFMKAYQQGRKLSSEYHHVRKPVYQLYYMLNHLRLFGQDYLKPTLIAIDKAATLV